MQPDQGQINSVWYRFTPTASGSAHFDTCTDVLYDGYMASYTGPAVNQLTNIGFNDDGCGGFGTGSILDFDVTAGTTYSIAIDGWESRGRGLHAHLHDPWRPTASTTTSATSASASATATASTTATSATASATASASATAATATATTAAATSGSLPRAAGDRIQARQREAADPQGQLLRRPRPPRSHQAIAARPRHRAEPEARRRQAQGLPGQPAGRPAVSATFSG